MLGGYRVKGEITSCQCTCGVREMKTGSLKNGSLKDRGFGSMGIKVGN